MNKKIAAVFLMTAIVFTVGLTGCGKDDKDMGKNDDKGSVTEDIKDSADKAGDAVKDGAEKLGDDMKDGADKAGKDMKDDAEKAEKDIKDDADKSK